MTLLAWSDFSGDTVTKAAIWEESNRQARHRQAGSNHDTVGRTSTAGAANIPDSSLNNTRMTDNQRRSVASITPHHVSQGQRQG
jgi:hypothetical protein